MDVAEFVSIPHQTELFAIRFNPGMLFYLLNTDMSKFKNKKYDLENLNKNLFKMLTIDQSLSDKNIVLSINSKLTKLLPKISYRDSFLKALEELYQNPKISINKLSSKNGFSVKNLERLFNKRIGLSPKTFSRIM